ncbi:hypothetical protein KKB44_02350 [Candidatus Micrarchaeota archaeon]|nr:hypothetical protein [Candidatus Micrarchaeota archaeon]
MVMKQNSKQASESLSLHQANVLLDRMAESTHIFSETAMGITCRGGTGRAVEVARTAIQEAYRLFLNTQGRQPESVDELFRATARSLALENGVADSYNQDERISAASMLMYMVRLRAGSESSELDLGGIVPRRTA